MACNEISDDRILQRSEVLLKDFIQDQLKEETAGTEVVLIEEPLAEEDEESRVLMEISLLVRRTAETLQRDTELNHAIDSRWSPANKDSYWKLVNKVFEDGIISWERIVVLFYISGRIAVKCVSAHLPQSVSDIISWTLDFFRGNLVGWIREQGGWESIFSCLSTPTSQMLAVFLSGILLGAFVVWRMTKKN